MTIPRRRPPSTRRAGFTLIEMVLVILVILILLGLTIAVVGRTVDGDRVRGGARQVQNYLAGARDRAIYAASRIEDDTQIPPAVGVRFIPDPAMTVTDDPDTPAVEPTRIVYSSMVFVQEVDPLPTRLTVYQEDNPDNPGTLIWRVSQFTNNGAGGIVSFGVSHGEFAQRAAGSLIVRGLIPGRYEAGVPTFYLPVYFDRDSSKEPYFVRFTIANLAQTAASGPPANLAALSAGTWWLMEGTLSKPYFDSASDSYTPQMCRFRVLPSVLPSEEPRFLPRSCVVDGNSSSVGGIPGSLGNLLRIDGSFDVMFNSRGIVEGPLASAGQVHLVVADAEDVERGFRVNNQFVDVDGTAGPDDADSDGNFDERRRDEFIVSVRTQTGSIYSSDVNPVYTPATGVRTDPFLYADGGGQAR